MESDCFASVILDAAVDRSFDYSVPQNMARSLKVGMRVLVPVRGGSRMGTVVEIKQKAEVTKTLPITSLQADTIFVSEELLALCKWVASYYCTSFYKAIKLCMPPSVRRGMEEKKQLFVKAILSKKELVELCEKKTRSNPSQAQVLNVLLKFPNGVLLTELLEKAEVSRSPVTALAKLKVLSLSSVAIDRSPLEDQDFFQTKPKKLSDEQSSAFGKIEASLDSGNFQTHLLHGVTGSGKTEIYIRAIEKAFSQGKGALFLVPEISLTAQTLERLKSRFQTKMTVLHHRLSDGEKRDAWHQIQKGAINLVIGARSAVFSPLKNLGLIIVDEEHEGSYKQTDESPCYNGRDVAIMRGKIAEATVVLGTATPAVETYTNALKGKYILSELSQRPAHVQLPSVFVVDMQREFEKASGFTLFSQTLLNEIETRLKIGEQSILFLNRRGFHTAQMCRLCAYVIECPHCAISLTFHKGENSLACHLCNYELRPPSSCPKCQSPDGLKYKGAGTELVQRTLHTIFPQIRTLRADADTTRHKGSHDRLFKEFRSGKADVLIGTQMVTKGLHFPSVTLVGVLNADAGLHVPDFRCTEHAFQMLTQVSGRSGRGTIPGKVIIQTRAPQNETILQASKQDYKAFYNKEISIRQTFHYPPYASLVKLVFSGESESATYNFALQLRESICKKLPNSFEINPVIPCGYAKIKDNFRFQFLIKGGPVKLVADILKKIDKKNRNVHLNIDIDPLSTFF